MFLKQTIPTFPVHNIQESVRFYRSNLSFEEVYSDENYAVLKRNDAQLHLWKANDKRWKMGGFFLIQKPIRSGAESFLAGTHSCRIQVEGIAELYDELKTKNVLHKTERELKHTAWKTLEFHVVDLYGNLITFFEFINHMKT